MLRAVTSTHCTAHLPVRRRRRRRLRLPGLELPFGLELALGLDVAVGAGLSAGVEGAAGAAGAGGLAGIFAVPPPLPPPGASCFLKMIACWPICHKLETTKYRTTPAGICSEISPKNSGKILPIIWVCGFWAEAGVRAVIWRCW